VKITGMDNPDYTELLKLQSAELIQRTPFCPEDQEIAEYFDGEMKEAEILRLESHLTDCHYCLSRIGVLERMEHSRCNKRIPGAVLATAKQMKHKPPRRQLKRAPAWAAAAVVVIALFTVVNRNQEPTLEPGAVSSVALSAEESSRRLRSMKRISTELDVLSPSPGAEMSPGSLIRWAEVPDTLHYNVYVLSKAGDVLWKERLEGTVWAMQDSPQLSAGSEYYLRIEALLPDGRTLSSKHLALKIAEQP